MLLAKIALFIFIFTLILFLAYRALWLVFFLFNFRIWEMIMLKFAEGFFESLEPLHRFLLLTFLAIISYLAVFFTTIRMPLIRYIILAVMFVFAVRTYSLADILVFKDYFVENGMWGLDYWIKQTKEVFAFDSGKIMNLFNDVLGVFVDFFAKIIDAVRNS